MNGSPSIITIFQTEEIKFGETRACAGEILSLFKDYKEECSITTKKICNIESFIKGINVCKQACKCTHSKSNSICFTVSSTIYSNNGP